MPDKAQERFYLSALREALPDFPPFEPVPSETPDFVVPVFGKTLGIEFTLFHFPAPEGEQPHQEWQALKDRIVARAADLHDRAGGPALYVSVYFSPRKRIRKSSVKMLVANTVKAVSLVSAAAVAADGDVEVPWQELPPDVAHIVVRRSINGSDRLWHADAGGWVASVHPEHIRSVLKAKAPMHRAARRQCDELWLVIVNDVFSRAAQAELAPETAMAEFEHPFDRVLWLIPHGPKVFTLRGSAAA